MKLRVAFLVTLGCLSSIPATLAQDVAPPVPQHLSIHSKVLNEDRDIWVRTPSGYQASKDAYPVLYQTDAPQHVNEIGSIIDFLVTSNRMPPVIVVGIGNTDRNRDLTPEHADMKNGDGSVAPFPTSGGADKFLDFIQTELIPEIEKRYRTARYRIFSGHSFGGLFAIHALVARPDLFDAYIAVSPSLQWAEGHTLHDAQQFLAAHPELNKTLFFSLGNEGARGGAMGDNFNALQKTLSAGAPKGLVWKSAVYPDEDHGSTVLLAHYAGLRTVFPDWQVPQDQSTGLLGGGLTGLEQHYRKLSERYGYKVPVPESAMNQLGYQLIGWKKMDDAIAVFQRNTEIYPDSANTYDSLGEGLEAAGKFDLAQQNFQKAVAIGAKTNDGALAQFKQHAERVAAELKAGKGPAGSQ